MQHRVVAVLAVTAALALGLAGCGSDAAAPSVLPPSAAASVITTPSVTSAAPATPTATPAGPAGGLSKFEGDPAVKAMRQQMLAISLAVNSDGEDVTALRATSTERRWAYMQQAIKQEFDMRYAGANPFTPLGVKIVTQTARDVVFCAVTEGYATFEATGQPKPREVEASVARVVYETGRWRVDTFTRYQASCSGITIPEVAFS